MKKTLLTIAAGAILYMGRAQSPPPATNVINFAWNPSSSGAAGYKLYQGPGSHFYTNVVNVGNVTNYAFDASILNRSLTNYFAATAYDTYGVESDFSNEAVLDHIPPPTNVVFFSVKVLTSPNVAGPYTLLTNLPAFTRTNPVGAEFVRATVAVSVTNVAK